MNFKYLTEIGNSYTSEVGTQGHRGDVRVWRGIEAKLKRAVTDLNSLAKASPAVSSAPVGGPSLKVKDLIKFHQSQHQDEKYKSQAAIEQARKEVSRLREWLRKEGATADANGNIEMNRLENLVVEYDSSLQAQGMTKIRFNNGRLFTDDAFQNPLNTDRMVTHFSGPGKGIYVMSKEGNLHVESHVIGHYHHSSLLAGKRVAAAGEIEVVGGQVAWLSNKSGHYTPQVPHLLQVLHILQKKNVSMMFKLSVFSQGPRKDYATVGEFVKERQANEEDDYELMKLLAYAAHLTDNVLGANGWRWRIAPLEEPGVHAISTGNLVPHKTVRQWLKSKGLMAAKEVQDGWLR